MGRRTVSSVKKSCDTLWSKVVKTRAYWQCERCGAEPEDPRSFHSHHVYGRSNHRLRFEPRNGMAVCYPCHRWAEQEPLDFAKWFTEHRTDDVDYLAAQHRLGPIKRNIHDYLDLEAELKQLLLDAAERPYTGVSGP